MKLIMKKGLSYLIDYALVLVFSQIYFFCAEVFFLNQNTHGQAIMMLICALITVLILTCYIPTSLQGQTIGQKLMKLKVVNLNGTKRSYWQSFLRECVVKITFGPIFIILNILYFIVHVITKREFEIEFPHDFLLKTKLVAV